MRQIPVTIVLLTGETYTACIETLETRKNEGEFMLLSGGKTYRLDTVKSVGGVEVGGKTCSV